MDYSNALDKMSQSACPSIRYRIRREILSEPTDSPAMINLQAQIQQDDVVRDILSWQKEDGWLGGHFHGDHGAECGIRHLTEKGVDCKHPVIQKTLNNLIQVSNNFSDVSFCLGHVGNALDNSHTGGSSMTLACVFAYAQVEDEDFIQVQIKEALDGFSYVLETNSIDEVYQRLKNDKLVFKPGTRWPGIYHLRLLAFTQSWRNDGNKKLLAASIKKLIEYSPIPPIKVLEKGQIMAPASFCMDNFKPDMYHLSPKEWMMWFHRTELIARLGIINDIPEINEQLDFMVRCLDENGGYFVKPVSHFYFNKWTQYIGLALEDDWKANGARTNDLTFRSLYILKLANRF